MTDAAASPNGFPGTTHVSIASGPLVGPVLRRLVGMLAARADLPLDRLDDAVLVADLIAARAPAHVAHQTVDVALEPGPRTLSLLVGPLRPGGGKALSAAFRFGGAPVCRDRKAGRGALCVRFSPPRPAIRNLRPADDMAS